MAVPPHRYRAFCQAVGRKLVTAADRGLDMQAVLAHLLMEQQVLGSALADPAFEAAFASAFAEAMRARAPHPDDLLTPRDAWRCVHSILRNRIRDTELLGALLRQPPFLRDAMAAASTPEPPHGPGLPDEKAQEIIERAVQPDDPRGPEPAVHVMATHLGHRITHEALAMVFRQDGPLLAPLTEALARQWPQAGQDMLVAMAGEWLAAREGPAAGVTYELQRNGRAYQQSMGYAEALQRRPGQAPGFRERALRSDSDGYRERF